MKELLETSGNGIRINGKCYKTIGFEDDIVLLGSSEAELKNALHKMG